MKSNDTVQISATIAKDLKKSITEEAERDSRSFSQTVEILLAQAVRERERQRVKRKRTTQEN